MIDQQITNANPKLFVIVLWNIAAVVVAMALSVIFFAP